MGCNYQAPVCVPGNPVGSMGGIPARFLARVGKGGSCYPESFFLWAPEVGHPGVVAALMLHRHLEFP